MAEETMEMGKVIYDSVCSVLDGMNIHYQKIEEDLVVAFGHHGNDMNHDLILRVNTEKEVIQLFEKLPFSMDESKAADIARAVCAVNINLLCGAFSYDLKDNLLYEVTQIYSGSLIGEETIKRMLLALVFTVEEYDDKFMALNKGYLKVENFIEEH